MASDITLYDSTGNPVVMDGDAFNTLSTHVNNTNNPHDTTALDIGALPSSGNNVYDGALTVVGTLVGQGYFKLDDYDGDPSGMISFFRDNVWQIYSDDGGLRLDVERIELDYLTINSEDFHVPYLATTSGVYPVMYQTTTSNARVFVSEVSIGVNANIELNANFTTAALLKLNPISYRPVANGDEDNTVEDTVRYGFNPMELQDELSILNSDGEKIGSDTLGILALAVKTIQELEDRISVLENN